jgi:hypothetical protein
MNLVHYHFPVEKIPLVVPLAAVVLAALVYFICWAVLA